MCSVSSNVGAETPAFTHGEEAPLLSCRRIHRTDGVVGSSDNECL